MIAQITNNAGVIDAVANIVHYYSPTMSVESLTALAGSVFILARILRKAIPDNQQTGAIGQILKHCALEINPKTDASSDQPSKPVIEGAKPTLEAPQAPVITIKP